MNVSGIETICFALVFKKCRINCNSGIVFLTFLDVFFYPHLQMLAVPKSAWPIGLDPAQGIQCKR